MSSDEEIPGLGRPSEVLRHNPAIQLERLPLSSEDYFVWTRVDGHTALREVILMAGFAREKTIAILRRLRNMGALLREGETPESVAALAERRRPAATPARGMAAVTRPTPARGMAAVTRPAPAQVAARSAHAGAPGSAQASSANSSPSNSSGSPAPGAPASPAAEAAPDGQPGAPARKAQPDAASSLAALGALTPEERAALAEDVDLAQEQKLRVLAMRRKLDAADHYAMLEVDGGADKRALRRSYFTLSKEFHPDRYYGKHTGSFGPWLAQIFARIKAAHEVLSDDKLRQEYESRLSGQSQVGGQSKSEYAAELFERACSVQTSGELVWALQLFAAAIRLEPQARYLSRAARCAIDAGDTALAVTHARQAVSLEPDNPSVHRVLAAAQEAAGDLTAAQATLEAALALKSENDALAAGLRTDLERVRTRLGIPSGP
jgi:tetratricopeptide (TPR) repeat protein